MEKNKCKRLPQWHCENYKPMSIEERAKGYTHRYATPFLSGLETAEYEAYKSGATEQKRIDIYKACDWLKKNTFLGTHPDELNEFCKAMD